MFNFGKHEGQTFATVYMKDKSYVEWTLQQDKCRMWKLKCFKYFLLRLSDLERVLKREGETEEMARMTRRSVWWKKSLGGHEGGGGTSDSMADMGEESEMERMVAIEEREEQREAVQRGELEMVEERQWEGKAAHDGELAAIEEWRCVRHLEKSLGGKGEVESGTGTERERGSGLRCGLRMWVPSAGKGSFSAVNARMGLRSRVDA